MKRLKEQDRERFDYELNLPLPGPKKKRVTPAATPKQVDDENAAFAAMMSMQAMTEGG